MAEPIFTGAEGCSCVQLLGGSAASTAHPWYFPQSATGIARRRLSPYVLTMPFFRQLRARPTCRAAFLRVARAALFFLAAACGKGDPSSPVVAGSMTVVSGDKQSTTVAAAATLPMIVKVLAQSGAALVGAPVRWTVAAGSATLADTSSTTGADGTASMTFVAGTSIGTITMSASAGALTPLQFTQTFVAGAPTAMVKFAGDGAAGLVNAGVQVVVKIGDKYGNAVQGVTVDWATGPEGGTLSAATSVSDVAGLARITLTLGAAPKVYTVRAASGNFIWCG